MESNCTTVAFCVYYIVLYAEMDNSGTSSRVENLHASLDGTKEKNQDVIWRIGNGMHIAPLKQNGNKKEQNRSSEAKTVVS